MSMRMLIDARHPEETRVAVVKGNRIEEFDFESAEHKQLKGNIYLAKVTRVEPSLQAAFVDYGGNRHGFLAFSEIHPDYYRIPVGDRPPDRFRPQERTPEPEPGHGDTVEFEAEETSGLDAESALPNLGAEDDFAPDAPDSSDEPSHEPGSGDAPALSAGEAMALEPAPEPDAPTEPLISP